MLTVVVSVGLTFLLTSVLGNFFLHSWQRRNWLDQQRLLDRERELTTLDELFRDVAALAGKRHFKMRRLLQSCQSREIDRIEKATQCYDETLVEWNEKLGVMYAELTMNLDWTQTRRLEDIQARFVSIGRDLESMVSDSRSGKMTSSELIKVNSERLDKLQAVLSHFYKELRRSINRKRASLYAEPTFSEANLNGVPTWKLFVSLFEPWKKAQ